MATAQRYRTILRGAGDLFARRGYHQASIRQIARAAGISLAGLYHYVESKEELLFLVLDRLLDDLQDSLGAALSSAETPQARFAALVETHLEVARRSRSAVELLSRDATRLSARRRSLVEAKRRAYLERGVEVLRDLDPRGRSDEELRTAADLLLAMVERAAGSSLSNTAANGPGVASRLRQLFLHGFLDGAETGDGFEPARGLV
jgi:AcrR family transcriptional regulator